MIDFELGEKVGSGASRNCYLIVDMPGYVCKVPKPEKPGRAKYNIYEKIIWDHADAKLSAYLVPVIDCHPEGDWLIMPLGEKMPEGWKPSKVPSVLRDWRKANNWVMLEGRPRMCDYGQRGIMAAMRLCHGD